MRRLMRVWKMPMMRFAVPVSFIYAYYRWGDAWESMIGTWWALLVYSLTFGVVLALMTPTSRPSQSRYRRPLAAKKAASEGCRPVDEPNDDIRNSPAYGYLPNNVYYDHHP